MRDKRFSYSLLHMIPFKASGSIFVISLCIRTSSSNSVQETDVRFLFNREDFGCVAFKSDLHLLSPVGASNYGIQELQYKGLDA